tara:strand:+ start:389 stop:589 length:201 start_codon:yes stop_codon:yes gene_type:complete
MRKTTDQEQEVLEFLNILRDSGATNMFGAVPYIKDEFNLDSKEAKSLLMLWMANFNDEGEYNEVKE